MPSVLFTSGERADCPNGGRLVDLCDEAGGPVPFGCRGGTCGACRVTILEGLEYLKMAGGEERAHLAVLGAGPRVRLACQVELASGPGVVRLAAGDQRGSGDNGH